MNLGKYKYLSLALLLLTNLACGQQEANKEKIQSNLEVISKVSQFIIDRIDEEAKRQEKETNKIEPQSV